LESVVVGKPTKDMEPPKMIDPTQTKEKLGKIMQYFDTFDEGMTYKTRERRNKDELRIMAMNAEMARLEKTLDAHVRRRIIMNKELQQWMESQLLQFRQRFKDMLQGRQDRVDERLDVVMQRLTDLEASFAQMKKEIPEEIERRTEMLRKLLHEFQEDFKREQERRIQREKEIMIELDLHEQDTAERFEVEEKAREKKVLQLNVTLNHEITMRNKGDEKFQDFVEEDIGSLKKALELESAAREREDDEIVDALNAYTAKLQKSLQIINSTEE
jgi:hypothetical protein